MRHIDRETLSPKTLKKLDNITQAVLNAKDKKAKAAARWKTKPVRAFEEVRQVLVKMASGRTRCMYCEDSLGTDIEHFRPKSSYPESAFVWENYLLACTHCNSNRKRTLFPLDAAGVPLLIDPSVDNPAEHLNFSPSTGDFVALSEKGMKSIEVFGLNDDRSPRRLPSGRRQALITLIALLKEYDRTAVPNPNKATEIRETICDHPFSAVLTWLVDISQRPNGPTVIGQGSVDLVRHHGLDQWL